jgi:hypothetical protein
LCIYLRLLGDPYFSIRFIIMEGSKKNMGLGGRCPRPRAAAENRAPIFHLAFGAEVGAERTPKLNVCFGEY